MKRLVCFALLVSFTLPNVALALDGKKAAYFGGTVSAFADAKDPVEGRLDTANEEALILTIEHKPYAGQMLRIPYASIEDLEYGQKAGLVLADGSLVEASPTSEAEIFFGAIGGYGALGVITERPWISPTT
jgi:hypothetical protein